MHTLANLMHTTHPALNQAFTALAQGGGIPPAQVAAVVGAMFAAAVAHHTPAVLARANAQCVGRFVGPNASYASAGKQGYNVLITAAKTIY